jgi:glutamine synthetase
MTTLVGYLQELGWDPYATDHEDANCQFEINWGYADALTTSDRHVFFRWMVKTVAEEAGLWATFMPKPFGHLTGNGSHFHLSLADAESERNLFLDPDDELGLSLLARHFMAGVLHHTPGLCAVVAPLVNSYKRLVRGRPRSGATWAPVYATYGSGNRTQMIRIPAPGRIEARIVDAAANPYLACAAMLAAGLDGIEKRMDPGLPNTDNLYEIPERDLRARNIRVLPATLKEALDALAEDPVICEALGREYSQYYIDVKTDEWNAYHQSVSQWEIDQYLNTH